VFARMKNLFAVLIAAAAACAAISASAATPTLVTTGYGLAAITNSLSGYCALGAGICAGRGAEWQDASKQ